MQSAFHREQMLKHSLRQGCPVYRRVYLENSERGAFLSPPTGPKLPRAVQVAAVGAHGGYSVVPVFIPQAGSCT